MFHERKPNARRNRIEGLVIVSANEGAAIGAITGPSV
jgi:hypothetical protein